ncbi:Uma2 family endonuclease [Aestuariivirga sp.]|uniref:Uma2 family endonuclease n=1 Tax=Aestuariivirga sp. TaxID=2650926 RepID=UPI0039E4B612
MAEPATRHATYADLAAVPPHLVAEIIQGALVTHPRPSPRHAAAHLSLGNMVGQGYQFGKGGPGGWIFLNEPELHLGRDVVVPDLAGWRRERLSPFPSTAWIETPPDWVCEILSDATEKYDRNEKRRIYGAAGVPDLWLLDPRAKLLECFRLVAGNWLLTNTFIDRETVKAQPFEAAAFALDQLWPFDEPDRTSE